MLFIFVDLHILAKIFSIGRSFLWCLIWLLLARLRIFSLRFCLSSFIRSIEDLTIIWSVSFLLSFIRWFLDLSRLEDPSVVMSGGHVFSRMDGLFDSLVDEFALQLSPSVLLAVVLLNLVLLVWQEWRLGWWLLSFSVGHLVGFHWRGLLIWVVKRKWWIVCAFELSRWLLGWRLFLFSCFKLHWNFLLVRGHVFEKLGWVHLTISAASWYEIFVDGEQFPIVVAWPADLCVWLRLLLHCQFWSHRLIIITFSWEASLSILLRPSIMRQQRP